MMQPAAIARLGYHGLSLVLGLLLRGARYSATRIVVEGDTRHARKRRAPYAALLIWLSGPLMRLLGTGVRVLPLRAWMERERQLYERLYGTSVQVGADGTLTLPFLPGRTLAELLQDRSLTEPARTRAIELAVNALLALHDGAITHGDAMAENVMVDLEGGVARWFDFETVHDSRRPMPWRRADDLRALLATCLVRSRPDAFRKTADLILTRYADPEVARIAAWNFASAWRRPLMFHLGQAPLSLQEYLSVSASLR